MRKTLFVQFTAILLVFFLHLISAQLTYSKTWPKLVDPAFDPSIPKKLIVEIDKGKFRKFQINLIKANKSSVRLIGEAFKKKFPATFSWTDQSNEKVSNRGKLRIQGQGMDHIRLVKKSQLISSISVKLKTGNLGGITRFKLLLPDTRGGSQEIFITTFLEKIGLLAPYTRFVNVNFNGIKLSMLFQEVAAKELLERYGLREAPIIESDERQPWLNRISKGGRVPDSACCFGILDNRNWLRSDAHIKIAQNALAKWAQHVLETNPTPLIANHKDKIYSLDEIPIQLKDTSYQEIAFALTAEHGLGGFNRKFYYDPMYNKLAPIYYDGYDGVHPLDIKRLENISLDAINPAILDRIVKPGVLEDVLSAYQDRGGRDGELVKIILEQLILKAKSYSRKKDAEPEKMALFNKTLQYDLGPRKYPFAYTAWDQNNRNQLCLVKVVGSNTQEVLIGNTTFKKNTTVECQEIEPAVTYKALEGRLSFSHNTLSSKITVSTLGSGVFTKQNFVPKPLFDKVLVEVHEDQLLQNPEIQVSEDSTVWIRFGNGTKPHPKTLSIKLMGYSEKQGRIILSGNLENLHKIRIKGENRDKETFSTTSIAAPFDDRLLTGCLTILDAKMNNLKIEAGPLSCEDSINIIRSSGEGIEINVSEAKSDALDVDFSKVNFSSISVAKAGNDCVDFSAGNYVVEKAELANCGDKGISVGEKAKAEIKYFRVDGANIGIASKDSSDVIISKSNIKNVRNCFASYKKKQEFDGAKLRINERPYGCANNDFKDKHSSIIHSK